MFLIPSGYAYRKALPKSKQLHVLIKTDNQTETCFKISLFFFLQGYIFLTTVHMTWERYGNKANYYSKYRHTRFPLDCIYSGFYRLYSLRLGCLMLYQLRITRILKDSLCTKFQYGFSYSTK